MVPRRRRGRLAGLALSHPFRAVKKHDSQVGPSRWLPAVLPVVLLPDDSVSLAIPTPSAEAEEAATATVQRMNWWARKSQFLTWALGERPSLEVSRYTKRPRAARRFVRSVFFFLASQKETELTRHGPFWIRRPT